MKKEIQSVIYILLLIANCIGTETRSIRVKEEKKFKRIRILIDPFENIGEKKYSWLSAGITDSIISDLSHVTNISVITDSDRKKALKEIAAGQTGIMNDETITRAGKITGANFILRGSYLVVGDIIRVNTRLIEIETGELSKTKKLDGKLNDIFDLQDKLAFHVIEDAKEISKVDINPESFYSVPVKTKVDIEAFEMCSKGKEIIDTNPTQALEYYKKAIQLSPKYIDALMSAGYVSFVLNHFSQSFDFYDRAKIQLEEMGKIESSDYAKLLFYIGSVYYRKGDLDKSISYYERSKNTFEKIKMETTNDYGNLMNGFGVLYDEKADYTKATNFYLKAKTIFEKLELQNTIDYAIFLMNIGTISHRRNEYDKALEYYNLAKEKIENLNLQNTEDFALILCNLGVVYSDQGNEESALESYIQSKDILINLKLQTTENFTKILNNIGSIYHERKEFDKAIGYFTMSKEIKENLNLQNTNDYANALFNLGAIYTSKGDKNTAKIYFQKAKAIYKKNNRKADMDLVDKWLKEL